MNILFLSELFYPHGSGAELATYKYAKLLSENGTNVIVVTNKFALEPDFSKDGRLYIYRLPLIKGNITAKYQILFDHQILFSSFLKKLFTWTAVVYIPRFWFTAIPVAKADHKPVLVHLHDYIAICPLAGMYDLSKGTLCCSRLCSQKCIFAFEQNFGRNIKNSFTSTLLNSTVGPQLGKLIGLSDALICVSHAQKSIIAYKAPALKNRIQVIYNPLPECTPTPIQGDAFAFLGGLNPLKGFNVVDCALTKVHRSIKVYATKFDPVPEQNTSGTLKFSFITN
jgi:glycosyltransferase involved in cell wall biosynthesis